jgi:DNA polymerase III epsilon subunit-like protein
MRPIIFIDCETTGLDPYTHGVWEVALVPNKPNEVGFSPTVWQTHVDLRVADPTALRVGGFQRRYCASEAIDGVVLADYLAWQLRDVTLAGCNPAFDAAFLRALLHEHGLKPTWHHRLLDLQAMYAGMTRAAHLSGTADLPALIGISNSKPHTALGDASWNKLFYDWLTK